MKGPERPPIPPLSDAAVSRIGRGVFAALQRDEEELSVPALPAARPSRRRFGYAVAAVALSAALVLGARELRERSGPSLRGARIATATSPSHVTVEGAAIDVAPASAIDFAGGPEGATVIHLERGSVVCEVAPRSRRAPFIVEAGATRVTVIGTRFGVTRTGDHARVWVVHGTVEVDDEGLTQLVHAGERYSPGEGATPGTVAAVASAGASAGGETPPAATPVSAKSALAAAPAATPAMPVAMRAESAQPAPERRRQSAAPLIALRAPAAPPKREAPRSPSAPPNPINEAASARPLVPPLAPAAASPSAGIALRARFESAAALEVRDPAAALRTYEELSSGSGPWAANALFAGARLSAEQGRRDRARLLLTTYLQRFPHGANAEDARGLLARLGNSDTHGQPVR